MNRETFLILSVFFFFIMFLPTAILAVCPVCTVAVACGVGLSRWLGIDDLISGVWIGGLIISTIILFMSWLEKKKIKFRWLNFIFPPFLYLLIITPLYFLEIMGHPLNKFWGVDKLLMGIIGGSLFFLIGFRLNNFLKRKNKNKAFFPFQKVILPVSFLLILSLIFKLIC